MRANPRRAFLRKTESVIGCFVYAADEASGDVWLLI